MSIYTSAQNNYPVYLRGVDKDSAWIVSQTGLQTSFSSRMACTEYITNLTGFLQSKGYVTASVDSLQYDSAFARIVLFIGELYRWVQLDAKNI